MPDQDKPAKVALNLDTLEREGRVDPFVFVLNKKRYTLPDPKDADFRDLLAAMHSAESGDFETAMRFVLDPKDRDAFFANRIPIWKLEPLFDGFIKHYGLPSAGEADALPTS